MKNNNITWNSGQILAEVVVAIGIIVVVLVGMSSLMTKTTKTVRQNTNKDTAVALVEAELSCFKNSRDKDQTAFFNTPPPAVVPNCACSGTNWSSPVPTLPAVQPICTVTTKPLVNGLNVTVTATWTEATPNDSSVSLTTSLIKF